MKLKTLNTTLLLIFKDNKVLLGEKKERFCKGHAKWYRWKTRPWRDQ